MAMLIRFRALSDENDGFYRDYDVPYDITLLDFHRFICGNLGFDPDSLCSFFTSNDEWEKLREFTALDVGIDDDDPEAEMPTAMDQINVGQLMRKKRDRLIYVFDQLNDRSLFLEVTGARECTGEKECQPRLVAAEADAPDQFTPLTADAIGSIFDEVVSEFEHFIGYESTEEES